MDELLEYKHELFSQANLGANVNDVFPSEVFFELTTELLAESGILDNVEYCPYRNTSKGMRIDGFSWNPLEKTICGLIVNFTNDSDVIATLTKTEITDLGKRVSRFFENVVNRKFIDSLEVTDPGRIAAEDILHYLDEAIKFRVVVITDQKLSYRVKKISIEPILERITTIEIWDIERLRDLDRSGSDSEEFTVDVKALGGNLKVLPANISSGGVSTYLGVMPGTLLSAIYDEFGQRLLESNVRTFLDFRASTNNGMRKSLLVEPENFFAYNNGLTVTASDIETEVIEGSTVITKLKNMQIVNGGQTTASIYFSPRDKGKISGKERDYFYKDIDLSKVYVQMKLTVVGHKETADILKANIANFANSQNSIQQSDLVSNHPFHLKIETRSRNQVMPASENGFPTKWFYERVRGQYSTQMRAMTSSGRRRFEAEYPKCQVFSKTDMAKYENIWRMKPHIVKKGAQANLKALGEIIIKEFEKDEDNFGAAFYKDLIAKMILFKQVDTGVLSSEWYKLERGLKVETVVYTISLLRYKLLEVGSDINLDKIYLNQSVSASFLRFLVSLAEKVRWHISDQEFRGGVTNPSEFCKSEKGWKKIQEILVDISEVESSDVLSNTQKIDSTNEKKELNRTSKSVSDYEYVMSISVKEWTEINRFLIELYSFEHKSVGITRAYIALFTVGKLPSDKQLKLAREIREDAYLKGFEYLN
jgi:hypothetical protein